MLAHFARVRGTVRAPLQAHEVSELRSREAELASALRMRADEAARALVSDG